MRERRKWHSFADSHSEIHPQSLITAYGEWVLGLTNAGFDACFLTFIFHQLSGSPKTKIMIMNDQVEHFYRKIVTRFVRKPRSGASQHQLPRLFGCADLPVSKHGPSPKIDTRINDGLHFHAILLSPPVNRLSEAANLHIVRNIEFYRRDTAMINIDVQHVTETPERATEYALKGLKHRPLAESILILPRTLSELSRRS